ncbi:MAG: glycosyltransferase [Planctomycetaceae bacterium]
MTTRHVVFVSYDGMTDALGQAQVIPYLEGLTRSDDLRFSIVSCEEPSRLAGREAPTRQRLSESGIAWYPLTYTSRPKVLSAVVDIERIDVALRRLHRRDPIDMVHARSYIPALLAARAQRRWRVPFVFDMRGLWADERVDSGLWPQRKLLYKAIYRYFKRQERRLLQRADEVICLTERARVEIHSWPDGTKFAPLTVIPCCADLDRFNHSVVTDSQRNDARRLANISGEVTPIGYVGSLGTWYMLDEMMQFFSIYKQNHPQAIFLVVTPDDAELVYRSADRSGVPAADVRVVSVSHAEVPAFMSLCRAVVMFIRPTYSKLASSPTKLAEALGMGLPVVVNMGVGDVDELVKEGSVIGVDPGDVRSLENGADAIDQFPLSQKGIRSAAERRFSLKEGVQAYRAVYTRVFNLDAGDMTLRSLSLRRRSAR